MHILLSFLLRILFLWGVSGTPILLAASPSLHSSLSSYIDTFTKDFLKQQKIIGCGVAIVDHKNIIFMKSYGFIKKGKPEKITLNTLFQLGSISKPITATLVAKLIKEGYLRLDLTTKTFIPSLPLTISLQQILSHTSGYARVNWNKKIEAGLSRALLLETLAQQKVSSSYYDYHNMVFSLVEEAISFSTRKSFEDTLKEELFLPLNMTQTTVGWKKETPASFAWPHQKNEKGRLYAAKTYSTFYHQTVPSAGGINSSLTDMVRFLQLQLGNSAYYLTESDLNFFHTPQVSAPDALAWLPHKKNLLSYYGLGWRIMDYEGERIIFHGGHLKGFRNIIAFIPQRKIGIIILNNSDSSFPLKLAFAFFDWIKNSSPK